MTVPPYPIPLARYAAIAGAEMLHIQPGGRYDSAPPALHDFRPLDAQRGREFLASLARPFMPYPPEAVMMYRDAFVLDGKQVLSRDGVGVAETYGDTVDPKDHFDKQHHQLGQIARGDVIVLSGTGPPVAAIAQGASYNFGHMLVETLPRLVHLADLGLRQLRLLMPSDTDPLRAMVMLTARALGLDVEVISCPDGSIVQVSVLHWVSPVSRHNDRKSPTQRRLMERLVAAVPLLPVPRGLYVARPPSGRRRVRNAALVETIAREAGYAVVEPSALSFAEQVGLFAGTRRAIGSMGAALTLIAAMPTGSHVAMFEAGNCDPFFWDLACLHNHRFDWAFTTPIAAYGDDMLVREMVIDPGLLRQMLIGLDGSPSVGRAR